MNTFMAFFVLIAVGAVVVALFARFTYWLVVERRDPRIDTTSIDWRNMARHRARYAASEERRVIDFETRRPV